MGTVCTSNPVSLRISISYCSWLTRCSICQRWLSLGLFLAILWCSTVGFVPAVEAHCGKPVSVLRQPKKRLISVEKQATFWAAFASKAAETGEKCTVNKRYYCIKAHACMSKQWAPTKSNPVPALQGLAIPPEQGKSNSEQWLTYFHNYQKRIGVIMRIINLWKNIQKAIKSAAVLHESLPVAMVTVWICVCVVPTFLCN